MEQSRLYYLFDRYTTGTITSQEELELAAYAVDPAYDDAIAALEARYWESLKDPADPLPGSADQSLRTILPGRVISLRRRIKVAVAAASIVLLFGLGYYFFFSNTNRPPKELVQAPVAKDVEAPRVTKATITLTNGQRISVDSLTQLTQKNVALIKTADGQLVYSGHTSEVAYNTVNNPRGSKVIDMTLADGTHFWLNAGSSITYPLSFTGTERKVSITGEAYFEVAHDASKPFIVSKGGTAIQVLGTHFNVNAYDDEASINVTLLEGSVKVIQGNNNRILKPGQQAQITNTITVVNDADLEQVMAWKNGQFKFSRTDLKIVMREIGRWYDVDVNYEGNIPVQLYNVDVPRKVNVSEVLKGLEYTGAHFTIEGKKITVRP
ncbi:MAG: FecR domain-containing protein [Sphingobacteriales bacterium]|nr:FecR domain-containing protein [Sphingobacteriales bacterium]OJV98376.1 MAG: hypothetical protein BGO52_11350 [Sphingobacteriales bacterium 44-61]